MVYNKITGPKKVYCHVTDHLYSCYKRNRIVAQLIYTVNLHGHFANILFTSYILQLFKNIFKQLYWVVVKLYFAVLFYIKIKMLLHIQNKYVKLINFVKLVHGRVHIIFKNNFISKREINIIKKPAKCVFIHF